MSKNSCELIALTGGPGAGKTAVLDLIAPLLSNNVTILPEAAGIVFGGGFWRLDSPSARKAAQRAIFHIQKEMEELVRGENKWKVGLCDRGTLDGLAYWPGDESEFWSGFNTSLEKEYSRYKAVIHLRSPGLQNGYNYQNPLRIETPDEAAEIDRRIYEIWKGHPNYFSIDSSDSFQEKVDEALQVLNGLLPACCDELIVKNSETA